MEFEGSPAPSFWGRRRWRGVEIPTIPQMPGLSLEDVSGLAEGKEEQEGTWVPGCVRDGHPGVPSVPT